MDLDTLIVTLFCHLDDLLGEVFNGQRLRQRGQMPQLCDAEVLTIEVEGFVSRFGARQAVVRLFSPSLQPLLSGSGFASSDDVCATGSQPVASQRTGVATSFDER